MSRGDRGPGRAIQAGPRGRPTRGWRRGCVRHRVADLGGSASRPAAHWTRMVGRARIPGANHGQEGGSRGQGKVPRSRKGRPCVGPRLDGRRHDAEVLTVPSSRCSTSIPSSRPRSLGSSRNASRSWAASSPPRSPSCPAPRHLRPLRRERGGRLLGPFVYQGGPPGEAAGAGPLAACRAGLHDRGRGQPGHRHPLRRARRARTIRRSSTTAISRGPRTTITTYPRWAGRRSRRASQASFRHDDPVSLRVLGTRDPDARRRWPPTASRARPWPFPSARALAMSGRAPH